MHEISSTKPNQLPHPLSNPFVKGESRKKVEKRWKKKKTRTYVASNPLQVGEESGKRGYTCSWK